MVQILEVIEGTRKAKGMTRKELSDKMNHGTTKESLNKIFSSDHCPSAYTIALMCEVLGLPTFPASWFNTNPTEE